MLPISKVQFMPTVFMLTRKKLDMTTQHHPSVESTADGKRDLEKLSTLRQITQICGGTNIHKISPSIISAICGKQENAMHVISALNVGSDGAPNKLEDIPT